MKVRVVDCNYVEPELACSYLLVEAGKGFFVECNTTHAIPLLVKAAKEEGLDPSDIEGLMITHVHLDHAGGTGRFAEAFPKAQIYAHPRAARHLVDPSRLIQSARGVYGDAVFDRLYGAIVPVDPNRVTILEDQSQVEWQGQVFSVRHTRGHANHHLCAVMRGPGLGLSPILFSGDSFGVRYPANQNGGKNIALVSTSPTDFDGEAAMKTFDWIESEFVESKQKLRIAPTHFGLIESSDFPFILAQLRAQIQFSMDLVRRIRADSLGLEPVTEMIRDWLYQWFFSHRVSLTPEDLRIWEMDIQINAQGLIFSALSSLSKK